MKNPIDAFILAKQEENDLRPAPPASPRTLLRRLYFDLIGLPPTPEQMVQFLENPSEEAYRAEIEKLLSDRRYGERWARHWLDLVRYPIFNTGTGDWGDFIPILAQNHL